MRPFMITTLFAALLAAFAGPASAAPQALLVAQTGEVTLACEGGMCAAEVTTLCLEPEKVSPRPGTRYGELAGPGATPALTLIGETKGGRAVALPPGAAPTVIAERMDSAVRLSAPRALMERYGLVRLRVRIARPATLVPARGGDPAAAAPDLGTRVRVAKGILGRRASDLAAARLTQAVINGLPRQRRAGEADLDAAWRRVAAAHDADPNAAAALATARWATDWCREPETYAAGRPADFRHCLGALHDRLMGGIRDAVRDALKPGS
jgi:hypothetical protein